MAPGSLLNVHLPKSFNLMPELRGITRPWSNPGPDLELWCCISATAASLIFTLLGGLAFLHPLSVWLCVCFRLCAAAIRSTAALMTPSATCRKGPATASRGAVLPAAGSKRCLRSPRRGGTCSATGRHIVLETPPAARRLPDSGRAAPCLRSVLGEPRRGVGGGLGLIRF